MTIYPAKFGLIRKCFRHGNLSFKIPKAFSIILRVCLWAGLKFISDGSSGFLLSGGISQSFRPYPESPKNELQPALKIRPRMVVVVVTFLKKQADIISQEHRAITPMTSEVGDYNC